MQEQELQQQQDNRAEEQRQIDRRQQYEDNLEERWRLAGLKSDLWLAIRSAERLGVKIESPFRVRPNAGPLRWRNGTLPISRGGVIFAIMTIERLTDFV